ncbi:MAG: LysM peptidoglycan-binding domain-containing protein [Parabacteroides sp.]|nr:LysM peptidoglycan-binding domain-containing protein [Parabacteroides sp.]
MEETTPETVKLSLRGLFKDGKAVVTVVPGITLSAIAALFDVTVDELVQWNNIDNPNKITVGQKITIIKTSTGTSGSQTAGSESFLFSPAMNLISLLLTIASTGASVYETLPTYNRMAAKLASTAPNRFLAHYNGKIVDWSMKFRGNQSVSKTIIATEKASYLKRLKWLKGVKWGGYIASSASVLISCDQMLQSQKIEEKIEAGTDTTMGLLGFLPGGWIASSLYVLTKPLREEYNKRVLPVQIEMGIEGCAFVMPFK